jgi:hypothetical protein
MSGVSLVHWKMNDKLSELQKLVKRGEHVHCAIISPFPLMPEVPGYCYDNKVGIVTDVTAGTVSFRYEYAFLDEHAGKTLTLSLNTTPQGFSMVLTGNEGSHEVDKLMFYWRSEIGRGDEEYISFYKNEYW